MRRILLPRFGCSEREALLKARSARDATIDASIPDHARSPTCATTSTADLRSRRSPAARSMAERIVLSAADGNAFAAYRARPAEPNGAGIVILPDVRGLHPFYEELALRFAERGIDALAIDYFGRTAGAEARGDDFEHMPHVEQTTWAGIVERHRRRRRCAAHARASTAIFTIGFCMGGRMSFLASTLGLRPRGRHRDVRDAPGTVAERCARAARSDRRRRARRSSGCSAAPTRASPPRRSPPSIAAWTNGPSTTGSSPTRARRTASSTGRPSTTRAESEAAWNEVIAFIGAHRDATA